MPNSDLSIISDDLPQTSLQVCYLQVYLTLLLGVTALGVLLSVLVLRIHHISPEVKLDHKTEVSIRCLRVLTFLEKRGRSSSSKVSPDPVKGPSYLEEKCDKVDHDLHNDHDLDNNCHQVYEDLEPVHQKVLAWTDVAATLDRLFFYLFSLIILTSTSVLPYIAINGDTYTIPTRWPTALGCFNVSDFDSLNW